MEYFASSVPTKEIQSSDEQDELRKLSVNAIHVIEKFTEKGDPVSVLNNHYQRNGIANITHNFKYIKYDTQERKKYWKCSFACPLSEQTVKSSILALALFHPEPPSALAELSEKIFGEYSLLEGNVYFDKKKGAKKSVAFAMLLHIFSSGVPDECNTIQKTKETKENKTISNTEKPPPSKKTLNRLRSKQIKWVDDLHEAGVRKVDISYHEYRSREESGSWRGQQTQIQCRMKTEKPLNIEVESVAATSRSEARCNAVAKLTEKLISCRDKCANDLAAKREESSTDVLIEKQKLVECDTPLCNFLFPPPHWAPNDLFLKECGDMSKCFFLFELSLRPAKEGEALPKNTTSIGMLFPSCKELSTKSTFEASFQFCPDGKECIVTLKNRQLLKAESDSRWHLLDKLNRINWKTYGTNNNPSCTIKTTRNYIFVPLSLHKEMKIDWKMVEDIVWGNTSPFLMVSRNFKASLVWAAVGALACIASRILKWTQINSSSLSWFFFATFVSHYFVFPDYKYHVADKASNYLLKHKTGKGKSFIYLISSTKSTYLNANSSFGHDKDIVGRRITFRDYFRERYGIKIKHPGQRLVTAYKIEKMSDYLHFEEEDYIGNQASPNKVHLIPELIDMLPMPYDFLSTIRFAANFMPPLERAVQLSSVSNELEKMTDAIPRILTNDVFNQEPINCKSKSLCNLLEDATTTYPVKRYEKLEFLGDSILNYLVVLNLFENNFSIDWHHDDLGELAQEAYKNTSLVDGALRAGLNRMLCVCMVRWNDNVKGSKSSSNCKEQRCLVSENTLSDVAESILASIYLHRHARNSKFTNSEMVVSFLKLLDLPLSRGASWLLNQGGCTSVGYSFQKNANWSKKLHEIAIILASAKVTDFLEPRRQALLSTLKFGTTLRGEKLRKDLEEWAPKILLHVALFDSSLDGTDGLIVGNGVEHAALLRDSLFHVGHSALSLILSEQLYHLHSNATTGDLHLLRSCMVSDDAIVYIMITWRIHKCLFDCLDVGVSKFEQHMSVANDIGRKEWDRNDGWFLPGGANEYRRRIDIAFPRHSHDYELSGPAYPGLAGGRLQGQKKKISKSITENLMFSFKCIVGAMTLSIGTNATWQTLKPLFEEAMVITPNEYRELFPNSICSDYGQGKTNMILSNAKK